MFESITQNLTGALSFFRRSGKLTEANIREGLEAVRQALLEADVNYQVAQDFATRIAEEVVGEQVLKSLDPTQQVIGIVHRQLCELMGPVDHTLPPPSSEPVVLMLCGLQGSGKTTTSGKLARMLQSQGRRPFLVAADLQRPAAIDQLRIIGEQLGVPVHTEVADGNNAVRVCQNGVAAARKADADIVILDTAGRLHIDTELMQELQQIDRKVNPHQILFVCDAMTGQDAVNSAKAFNEALELDGVILTKLDGDARGGAALSVKAITGVPIKYIGVGEQLDKLEPFHPDRMAGRILGMGDVVTLFEKAQEQFDADQVAEQQKKMMEGKFTLVDFKSQMQQIKRLGSLKDIMKMIPGMGNLVDAHPDMDAEGDMQRISGIIDSMTPEERVNPELIDIGRRRRIAAGSGVEPSDVNKLLKDFSAMAGVMQDMASMPMWKRLGAASQLANTFAQNPGAQIQSPQKSPVMSFDEKRRLQEKKRQQRKDTKKAKKRNRR
jgi:signal recognition particle subunit SRP54